MKSQLSLEFLLLLAAFFAFLALFSSVAKVGLQKSISLSKEVTTENILAETCFYIDFFSLNGLHTVSVKNFENFSAEGKVLFLGNYSRECNSGFRFEGTSLKIENSVLEVR